MAKSIVSCSLLLAGIFGISATTQAATPVYFGCIEPLSGASAGAGKAAAWGFELAIEKINSTGGLLGAPVSGVCLDDEGKPDKAVEVAKQHIAKGAKILLGAINSGNVIAFSKIAQEQKIPVMIPAASAAQLTTQFENQPVNYIFRFAMSDLYQGELIARYSAAAVRNDGKKIAVLHDTEGFGLSGQKIMGEIYQKLDIKDYKVVPFPKEKSSFLTEVSELKKAGVKVIVAYALPIHVNQIAKDAESLNFDVKIVNNWALWNPGSLAAGKTAEKIIAVISVSQNASKATKEFDKIITKKYLNGKNEPYNFAAAAQSYDATLVSAKAIELAGSTEGDAIVSGFYKIPNYKGVSYSSNVPLYKKGDHEALGIKDMHFARWLDKKIVNYEDAYTNISNGALKAD